MRDGFDREISDALNAGNMDVVSKLLQEISADDVYAKVLIYHANKEIRHQRRGAEEPSWLDRNTTPMRTYTTPPERPWLNYTTNPLQLAVQHNLLDAAKSLIDKCADLNINFTAGNYAGVPPIWMATIDNKPEMVALLLEKEGINVDAVPTNIRLFGEHTPLYIATKHNNLPIVTLLLQKNADVNIGTHNSDTPLMMATSNNNFELALLLLKNGAKVDLKNEKWTEILAKLKAEPGTNDIIALIQNAHEMRSVMPLLLHAKREGPLEDVPVELIRSVQNMLRVKNKSNQKPPSTKN